MIAQLFLAASLLFSQETIIPSESDTSEDSGYIITDDGIRIHYDNSAMDGGIDYNPDSFSISKDTAVDPSNKIIASETGSIKASSMTIPITFQTQLYSNYCGPAAVKMVLSGIGVSKTQTYIAGQIQTNSTGTSFGDNLRVKMNSMASGTGVTFYLVWHVSTNISTLKSHFTAAIEAGNPVLVNTDESDRYRFQGHSSHYIIYHYACVNGFTNSGEYFRYNDPASGYSTWTDIPQAAYYSKSIMSSACGNRGYIW